VVQTAVAALLAGQGGHFGKTNPKCSRYFKVLTIPGPPDLFPSCGLNLLTRSPAGGCGNDVDCRIEVNLFMVHFVCWFTAWDNVMSRSKKSVVKESSVAIGVRQILRLFGPPPLLSTERREHFEHILTHFVTAIAPTDAILQMWAYDITVLVWEMMRLRRYKAALFEQKLPDTIREIALQFIRDDYESIRTKISPTVTFGILN
jgi:hypothetical protein